MKFVLYTVYAMMPRNSLTRFINLNCGLQAALFIVLCLARVAC